MTHRCKNFEICNNTVDRISNIKKDNFYLCFTCKSKRNNNYYHKRSKYIKADQSEKNRINKLHCENMVDYWSKKLKSLK